MLTFQDVELHTNVLLLPHLLFLQHIKQSQIPQGFLAFRTLFEVKITPAEPQMDCSISTHAVCLVPFSLRHSVLFSKFEFQRLHRCNSLRGFRPFAGSELSRC